MLTTIRDVEDEDVEPVLVYIAREVARSGYQHVLPDPLQDAGTLMKAARDQGVALGAFDEAGRVVGCLIMPMHAYMGAMLAEEVAWFAETQRDLLRLFDQGEVQAVQKGASVVRMSAPAWTQLGAFYGRRGYQPLETSYVKVLSDGSSDGRRRVDRRGDRDVHREEEGKGQPTGRSGDA